MNQKQTKKFRHSCLICGAISFSTKRRKSYICKSCSHNYWSRFSQKTGSQDQPPVKLSSIEALARLEAKVDFIISKLGVKPTETAPPMILTPPKIPIKTEKLKLVAPLLSELKEKFKLRRFGLVKVETNNRSSNSNRQSNNKSPGSKRSRDRKQNYFTDNRQESKQNLC